MPKQTITDETIAAIETHWAQTHEGAITRSAIVLHGPDRLPARVKVTVIPETTASPAWFVCRACPDGLRRHRTDLGADPKHPPARHTKMIRTHLRIEHEATGRQASQIIDQIGVGGPIVYLPALRAGAPKIQCDLCPQGHGLRILDDPAYGDARSFWELGLMYPEDARRINPLPAPERAIHWEAIHRGITITATTWQLARALREEREAKPDIAVAGIELGLRRLMLNYVSLGQPITEAIDTLTDLMARDEVACACELARSIPGWERHLTLPTTEIAGLIVDQYAPLTRDRRTLWRYWRRTPVSLRHKAEAQGEERRGKSCQ